MRNKLKSYLLKSMHGIITFLIHKDIIYITAVNGMDVLIAQTVKNLPAMQETRVQSLGWEDPLEKGEATHSVF